MYQTVSRNIRYYKYYKNIPKNIHYWNKKAQYLPAVVENLERGSGVIFCSRLQLSSKGNPQYDLVLVITSAITGKYGFQFWES